MKNTFLSVDISKVNSDDISITCLVSSFKDGIIIIDDTDVEIVENIKCKYWSKLQEKINKLKEKYNISDNSVFIDTESK